MASFEGVARPFATAILAKAQALGGLELTKKQRARVLDSIGVDIRQSLSSIREDIRIE